jgi:hypothetical protein
VSSYVTAVPDSVYSHRRHSAKQLQSGALLGSGDRQQQQDCVHSLPSQSLRGPLPKKLSPDQELEVDALFALSGPAPVRRFARDNVSPADLKRLMPRQLLNDAIINFYGAMIMQRANKERRHRSSKGESRPWLVYYHNSFFWPNLKLGYKRKRMAKWTKYVSLTCAIHMLLLNLAFEG